MGYRLLTCRESDTITIRAQPGTDPRKLLEQLLFEGTTVTLKVLKDRQAKIAIVAPRKYWCYGAS